MNQAIQNFHDTVRRTNGKYEVTWPWKEANPRLPDNYQLVFGRLHSLLKWIQGKPELLQKYDSIIEDQIRKEIIEKVKDRTERRDVKNSTILTMLSLPLIEKQLK